MKSETALLTETALITGSSSGIGFHLAMEFARRRHALVLIAPVASELQKIASELKTVGALFVRTIAKDLEKPEAPQEIFDELSSDRIYIDILVNNAGFGHRGKFWEIPIEHEISVLRLNIEAVLRLTKLFLPPMLQRRQGRILNVASVAGFEPGPLFAVYHASKAFVLSLTEALAIGGHGCDCYRPLSRANRYRFLPEVRHAARTHVPKGKSNGAAGRGKSRV